MGRVSCLLALLLRVPHLATLRVETTGLTPLAVALLNGQYDIVCHMILWQLRGTVANNSNIHSMPLFSSENPNVRIPELVDGVSLV